VDRCGISANVQSATLAEVATVAAERPQSQLAVFVLQIVADVKERDLLTDSKFIRFEIEAAMGDWPARSRFAGRFGDLAHLRAMERAS
jgi:hypothetical protein